MNPSNTCRDLLTDPQFPKKAILEKLLRHRVGLTKTQLFAHPKTPLTNDDRQRIIDAYNAHVIDHKPIEYIIGSVEFLGVNFTVNGDTLIPRPETEYMINAIREFFLDNPNEKSPQHRGLFDIGTGCGVLGLSVLWHVKRHVGNRAGKNAGKSAGNDVGNDVGNGAGNIHQTTSNHSAILFDSVVCTDISPDALIVAEENWKRLFVGVDKQGKNTENNEGDADSTQSGMVSAPTFLVADLFDHATIREQRKKLAEANRPVLIVANLPYIPQDLFDTNTDKSVHNREPAFAFVGGDDGLDRYRKQFDQIIQLEADHPVGAVQFLEMMTRQVDILTDEYGDQFTFQTVKTFHFNIRIVKVSKKGLS